MKNFLLAGIFSLLALAPFSNAQAQNGGTSPDPKPDEKASAMAKPAAEPQNTGTRADVAKNHTTAGITAATTAATPDVSASAPSSAQQNFDTGVALYNSDKLADAVLAFKEANKLKPDDAQTNYMLGMSYWKLKNYYAAVDSFRRAVKIKPDWDEAYFRLGLTYYVLGRANQSTETYKRLQEMNPVLAAKLWRVIGDPNAPIPAETVKAKPASANPVEIVPVSSSAVVPPANNKPVGDANTSSNKAVKKKPKAPTTDANAAVTTAPPTVKIEPPVAKSNEKSSPPTSANAATSTPTSAGTAAVAAPLNVTTAAAADNLPLTEIYRVGVGDVLDIRLLNMAANRSTLYSVIDGGFVDFPIAGAPIAVAGLTTKEIQARIASELKRLAVADQTQVAVGVRQYGSHTVVVTGLVGSPGTKVLRREAVPLYVLFSEIQPRLDAARIVVMRAGSSPQILDLTDDAALNFIIRPGDVLNLTGRQPDFYYIAGKTVGYPGQKAFQPGITLIQAILAAGGLARDGAVELSREGADGHLTTTKLHLKEIKAGKIQDPKLQPGDRVEVLN